MNARKKCECVQKTQRSGSDGVVVMRPEWNKGTLNWKKNIYDQSENLTVQNTRRWMASDAWKLLII